MNYKKENIKNKIIDDLNTRNENWEKLSRAQSFINDKEETRKESEAARELNEEERKLNETARVKAENERVSAEQNRVTAENERNDLHDVVQQKLENGEFIGEKGELGPQGPAGADGTMTFEDLTPAQVESLRGQQGLQGDKGDPGPKGDPGEKGDKGDITDLSANHIETALGFMPVHPVGGVTTKRKETRGYYELNTPGVSTNIDISASNTIFVKIWANNVFLDFVNMNEMPNTNDTVRMIYDNTYNGVGLDAYINVKGFIDGVWHSEYKMYKFPSGVGVIEFDFVRMDGWTDVYGTTGGGDSLEELTKDHVETALGYVPADEADLSTDAITIQGRNPSNFVEVVNHGATSNYARPVGGISVLWIGTVEPQNAIDNDIWIGGL